MPCDISESMSPRHLTMKTILIAALVLVVAAVSHLAAAQANDRLVVLNFPNTDVNDVLAFYESLTHFKIIRDNFVQGKISISVGEPITPDKAIEIIERTLFADGFAI